MHPPSSHTVCIPIPPPAPTMWPHTFADSFGPFDGRAFCTWWSWVITTPNQDTIPTPNLRDCKVHLRSDLRYGPDDHTLWPQVFVPEYPHLAAIPRKPEDPHHPLSIMWYNPTTFDFVLCPNSLIDGLGQLSPSRFKALDDCRREVDARVRAYVEATEKPDNLVQNLLHVTRHSGVRICSLQTTFLEMLFGVTEFQRYFLELLGRIDFLEIYQPRMEGRAPCATSAADCLGAFTNNPQVAQQLFDAGLPLYLFWPSDRWSANNHVTGSLVKPLRPSDIVFAESETPFPVIFQGSAMDHKKHASMHNYSRTWMIYGDPFANEHNDLDPHTTGESSKWYASRTIPISDLLQPRLPVTSSSSQSLSASSLRSLSRRSKGSKASGKSMSLSFFPDTYLVKQGHNHIRNKQDARERLLAVTSFGTLIALTSLLLGGCGLMPSQQSTHHRDASSRKPKASRTSDIMPFLILRCSSHQLTTRRKCRTF